MFSDYFCSKTAYIWDTLDSQAVTSPPLVHDHLCSGISFRHFHVVSEDLVCNTMMKMSLHTYAIMTWFQQFSFLTALMMFYLPWQKLVLDPNVLKKLLDRIVLSQLLSHLDCSPTLNNFCHVFQLAYQPHHIALCFQWLADRYQFWSELSFDPSWSTSSFDTTSHDILSRHLKNVFGIQKTSLLFFPL